MRKILLALGLAAGLMLAAAPAEAVTTVERSIPFEESIDACGETISLSGTLMGIFSEQRLGKDGFLFTSHFNPQGLSGTSSSGATYNVTGLTRTTTVIVPSGGLSDTYINRFQIVGTGGSIYYAKGTVHLTVTPSSEISVNVSDFSVECV